MKSQVFQFVFRDVGMGKGECQVEIRSQDSDRLSVILTESGKTRLGSIRSAFDLVATQLYAKRLFQDLAPSQITWFYRESHGPQARDEKIDLSWDGERFSAETSIPWLGRPAFDAILASGFSAIPSN